MSAVEPEAAPAGSSRPEADPTAREARRSLAIVLVASGLLRLALWTQFEGAPLHVWDERDYNALAVNLAEHGQFAFTPGRPISLRPPLYPAVVSAVYRASGFEDFQAVRLLQVGLGLLTVALLYGLGSEVYSRRVGLWAAGLYGFYPSMLAYDHLLLTEVQFTALLVASCYGLARALRVGSFGWLALSGVLLGLAALTRSILWPSPVVLGAFLLGAWPGAIRGRLLAAGVLAATFSATLAPWAIRNQRLERTFMTVDCMGGRNFMMGNYEYTPMFRAWDAISVEGPRSWHRVLAESDPGSTSVTQGQKDKRALRRGLAFVLENPGLTLKRDVVKFCNFWGLERELIAGAARGHFGRPSLPRLGALALVILGGYTFALISGLFGAILAPSPDRRHHALLLLVVAYICGMHTLTFAHSRYHLPVMPLVLLYSAAAIVHARPLWARRRGWAFRMACGLALALLLVWASEAAGLYLEQSRGGLASFG